MSHRRSPAIGLMLTLGLVLGCSNEPGAPSPPPPPPPPPPGPAPVATVTVAPTQGQILVGGTIVFAATLRDAANAPLTGRTVTWASSDNSVATVAVGVVTGVVPGAAIITATSEGKQGNASITVLVPAATVTVSPDPLQLGYNATAQLTATVQDAQGNDLLNRIVTWSTSDPAVAGVMIDGSVTGAGPGSATITATVEGVQGAADVTVAPLVLTMIEGGSHHGCGLTSDGTAYCWGNNSWGELGVAGSNHHTPTPVGTDLRFVHLAGGEAIHTCGLTPNGTAYCWGLNSHGQLGTGTTTPTEQPNRTPMAVSGGLSFSSLSRGSLSTCGVATSTVYCWGDNRSGQLATGDTLTRLVPTPIAGDPGLVSVVAGGNYACGLTAAGAAHCWGGNFDGQLGNGTTARNTTPTAVIGGLAFDSLSLGGAHTCGLTTTGSAYCWGNNGSGRLGDGTTTNRSAPVLVSGGLSFTSMSNTSSNVCGLAAGGAMYCWGRNHRGQLGTGTTLDQKRPTPVVGGLTFTMVSGGLWWTYGIATDGKTYGWGRNTAGMLGDGTTTDRLTPTMVAGQQ